MLRATVPVLAAFVMMVIMAIVNATVWDGLRPPTGRVAGFLAYLTGLPWLWPNAPMRFLVYNLPIWGIVAAIGYGVVWEKLSGRPVRWLRVAVLWSGMSLVVLILAALVRSEFLSGYHASAALLWLYLILGIGVARDWVVR